MVWGRSLKKRGMGRAWRLDGVGTSVTVVEGQEKAKEVAEGT